MASCRNLVITLLLVASACASPSPVSKSDTRSEDAPVVVSENPEMADKEEPKDEAEMPFDEFYSSRSRLNDTYSARAQWVSNPYDVKPIEKNTVPSGNQGFRIQIATSDRLDKADSVKTAFDLWADSANVDYRLYSYVEFRSPKYRVNVGDFYDRADALELGRILRRYFRESWVVYDKINQERSPYYQRLARQTPSDTLQKR